MVQFWRSSRSSRKEFVRSPLAGLLWERQFEKVLLEHGWEKVSNWECLFVKRAKGLFLSVYVDDIKLAGKKQNLDPMWKILNKDVDLGEPTSFLDHVYMGCTQRECRISNDIVTNHRDMCESRISAGAKENYTLELQGNLMQKSYRLGLSTWKVMPRNVWKDIANFRFKRLNNYTKSQHHAWMTIVLKKWVSRRIVCNLLQIVLKCLYLARIGRPDILLSVNKLALRSQNGHTLATNAWRVVSLTFIIQVNTSNIFMWETQHNSAGLVYFKTLILQEISRLKINIGGVPCIFGSRTFVPISWMCKKQTSVSHSSTEAEIISLDAVFPLSLFGIWWLKYFIPYRTRLNKEELRGNPLQATKPNVHNPIQFKHTNVIRTNIDHIPSNTMHSGASAMLYVFEDNEAVMKIVIKGGSHTMRYVSRTHRVALDWLFDTIKLDPKKSKSVTLTPNTNWQTSWPKGISRVMSGIIFFSWSILANSALFAAPKISAWSAALRWQKNSGTKRRRKGCI